jgi:hypothetical protein
MQSGRPLFEQAKEEALKKATNAVIKELRILAMILVVIGLGGVAYFVTAFVLRFF